MDYNYEEGFRREEFLSNVNLIVNKVYQSISHLELNDVRHYLSDEIYHNISHEIEKYKDDGKRLVYDEVNVQSQITNAYQDSDYYYIEVKSDCKYLKYFILDGGVIEGNNTSRVEVPLRVLFQKRKDATSQDITRCSGCGTTLNIHHSGKCPNCGRIYDYYQYDYIIVKVDTL